MRLLSFHHGIRLWKKRSFVGVQLYHSENGVYGHPPEPRAGRLQNAGTFPAKFSSPKSYYSNSMKLSADAEISQNRNNYSNFHRLVTAYREHGHKVAELDPLGQSNGEKEEVPELKHERYEAGSDFKKRGIAYWSSLPDHAEVSQGLQLLKDTYTNKVGYEFMYIEVGVLFHYARKMKK